MKHVYWLLLILLVSSSALAQTGSLRGQVTDQNGGNVPGAKVTIKGRSGLIKTTNTDKSGSYSFAGLPAGDYEVQASAPNLELAEPVKVSLDGYHTIKFDPDSVVQLLNSDFLHNAGQASVLLA